MKNTSLEPLSFLIGKWKVQMVHVALPNPLEWEDSFEWLEDSFILWHWQGKDEVPKSISVIGRNENKSGSIYTMLYYDVRGISRKKEMSYESGIWKFKRIDPEFSQRFEAKISKDKKKFEGIGEMSKDDGKTWVHDFSIIYTKIE